MSIFTVDKEECVSCGACVDVCPTRIIELDSDKHPKIRQGREEFCINCGHCACVCPKGAISLETMPIDELKDLHTAWRLTPEKLEEFLKGRRSIRAYKEDVIEKATIEKIIDIARYAPTGINRQEIYWAVVHDPAKVRELAGLTIEWMRKLIDEKAPMAEALHFPAMVKAWEAGEDRVCRKAPHAVIVYGLKQDPMAPTDCVIAMAQFELAAIPFGLGACWAGYLKMALNQHAPARKAAGLSTKTTCHGAMLLGYPKHQYNCIPLRVAPRIIWR